MGAAEWVPESDEVGRRSVPEHVLVGESKIDISETKTYSEPQATHVLAVRMQDDRGVEFWGVDKQGRAQTLLHCSDAVAISYLTIPATPDLFGSLQVAARPYVEETDATRLVQYAVLRLSDGAVIGRLDRRGTAYAVVPVDDTAARYIALSEAGEIMGLSKTVAGAEAAARAYSAWVVPWGGVVPYPAPGAVLRWVVGDLVEHKEVPRLIDYAGRACVGLVGEALPVRPTEKVNADSGEPARMSTHAVMTPGTMAGEPMYACADWNGVDAASDAEAVEWMTGAAVEQMGAADLWGRPYSALRRVLVRMSDGVPLGECVNDGNGNWVWSASTDAGNVGVLVWRPSTESVAASVLGATRAGSNAAADDIARTSWDVVPGEPYSYYTTTTNSRAETAAVAAWAESVPEFVPA